MSERKLKNILVTGGCGFIGSNFINYLFGQSATGQKEFMDSNFTGNIINVDCLTYAGNAENLEQVQKQFGGSRYFFERTDICDRNAIEAIFKKYDIDTVIHFAAESHVDRSILGPEAFVKTNILGTYTLLDVARTYWNCSLAKPRSDVLFHHISGLHLRALFHLTRRVQSTFFHIHERVFFGDSFGAFIFSLYICGR